MTLAKENRRRVPRRSFDGIVGVLISGEYALERAFQVGEGGMMISCRSSLPLSRQIAVTFYLPSGVLIAARATVRSIIPAEAEQPVRYGLEFVHIDFNFKREIRNFVAAATFADGHVTGA